MRRSLSVACVVAALFSPIGAETASAQTVPEGTDRIEEDWELVVGQPDTVASGPQVTTAMCPVADGSEPTVALNINYRQVPSFAAGGIEVLVLRDKAVQSSKPLTSEQFQTQGETVRWTQRLELSGGSVEYSIPAVNSTTFTSFQGGTDVVATYSTAARSLAAYSPLTSVKSSGVPWQRNRVTSMKLVRVRYFAGAQLLQTDSTSRSVDLSY